MLEQYIQQGGVVGLLAVGLTACVSALAYLLRYIATKTTPIDTYHKAESKLDEKDEIIKHVLSDQALRVEAIRQLSDRAERIDKNVERLLERKTQ